MWLSLFTCTCSSLHYFHGSEVWAIQNKATMIFLLKMQGTKLMQKGMWLQE